MWCNVYVLPCMVTFLQKAMTAKCYNVDHFILNTSHAFPGVTCVTYRPSFDLYKANNFKTYVLICLAQLLKFSYGFILFLRTCVS